MIITPIPNAPKPMLAHVLEGEPDYPVMMQPKLDGVRCLLWWDNAAQIVRTTSRNGKPLHRPVCLRTLPPAAMKFLSMGWIMDGELYSHGKGFATVLSWTKRENHPQADQLEYHIYDALTDMGGAAPFHQRSNTVDAFVRAMGHPNVKAVGTYRIENRREADTLHRCHITAGYEGSMYRIPSSYYEEGKRSRNLLKRKDFKDEEYRVMKITEGVGKNAGTAILHFTTDSGQEFTATAPGTYEIKGHIWRNRLFWIGKKVTIKYQEMTDDGIPRFPIAIRFREDE